MSTSGITRRRLLAAGSALAASSLLGQHTQAHASVRERDISQWDLSTDALIVGSGVAGMAAAIEARRAGADTLVLEMQESRGGSSAMSGGVCYLGGGTALQKALGFDDSVEAMLDYIVAASGPHPHLERIQKYCEGAVGHFDWLVANGVPYTQQFQREREFPQETDNSLYYSGCELNHPFRDIAKPAPRGHVPGVPGHGGWRLMQALNDTAEREGSKVLTAVTGKRLVQADDGRVLGLEVMRHGKLENIRARKGVVLACGGFIRNHDMVKHYAPEVAAVSTPHASPGDLGLGILMGMGVGAAAIRMHQAMIVLPTYPPERALRGIFVNRRGQRFMAEDYYYGVVGHEVVIHQGGVAYIITDADHAYPDNHFYPHIAQANSIRELEQSLDMPDHALQETVAYYNRHATQQADPLFHKHADFIAPIVKPPFHAWRMDASQDFAPILTFGGLLTNTDAQVLHASGDVIPGLYAAGRTANGLPQAPYMASGLSVGDGSFFGRCAGRHLATRQ